MRSKRNTKKKLRSSRKRRSLGSRKVGGVLCGNPFTLTEFKWDKNSCYFDTALFSFLHLTLPEPMVADNGETTPALRYALYTKWNQISGSPDPLDKTRRKIIVELLKLFDLLHGDLTAFKTPVAKRENALKQCTASRNTIRKLLNDSGLTAQNLTTTDDPPFLYDLLFNFLELERTFILLSTGDNAHVFKVALSLNCIEDGITNGNGLGELPIELPYDILPINIERLQETGARAVESNEPVNLPETVEVFGVDYELQSVLCKVNAGKSPHYVGYFLCADRPGSWLFYDDIHIDPANPTIVTGDVLNTKIPNYDLTPRKRATFVVYVKKV